MKSRKIREAIGTANGNIEKEMIYPCIEREEFLLAALIIS